MYGGNRVTVKNGFRVMDTFGTWFLGVSEILFCSWVCVASLQDIGFTRDNCRIDHLDIFERVNRFRD